MLVPINSPVTNEKENGGDLTPRPLDEIFATQQMLAPPLPPLEPLELTLQSSRQLHAA